MHLQGAIVPVFLYTVFIYGASIFMYGFFPLSHTSIERASIDDLPTNLPDHVPLNRSSYQKSSYDRTVLMMIDALRTDFVQAGNIMTHLRTMIENRQACMLHLRVEAPTVTMPRIKAITSGTIPNFIDVVLNFGHAEFVVDSFVRQLTAIGRRIIFAGDNTWTKLFGGQFNRHFENSDSLFVNDFYEGDNNITKQLGLELSTTDWHLMIVHYLGLDHIGHVEGPLSAKVPPKLAEMDRIIETIHNAVPFVLITGDHGMRDTGGHGGSSYAEVNIPLVVSGTKCKCSGSNIVYNQIDLAPTISVLLGVPIPAGSIGIIIPELIEIRTTGEQLYAFYYNNVRLLEKIQLLPQELSKDREFLVQHREAEHNHKRFEIEQSAGNAGVADYHFKRARMLYVAAAQEMSNELSGQYVKFDHYGIAVGLLLTSVTFIAFVYDAITEAPKYQLNGTILAATAICLLVVAVKYSLSQSISVPLTLLSYGIVWCLCVLRNILIDGFTLLQQLSFKTCFTTDPFSCCLIAATLFHAASYASSSFIEEEHQLWYYMTNTLLLTIFVMWLRKFKSKSWFSAKKGPESRAADIGFNWKLIKLCQTYCLEVCWMFVLAGQIFLRRLNQTGDKWLSVPDIGDWLVMDGNRMVNSGLTFFALFLMIFNCIDYNGLLTNILTITAALLVYYYRAITGTVYFAGLKPSSFNMVINLFWLNIVEILAINYLPIAYKLYRNRLHSKDVRSSLGTLVTVFCLISALLHKPHNVVLNAGILISCYPMNATIDALCTGRRTNIFVKTVAHYWIGKMFFFYQGNSNSLASIDLNAGYVGLKQFSMSIVAIFLTLNTYNGVILSYLVLIYNIYVVDAEQGTSNILIAIRYLMCLVGLPFTFYLWMAVVFQNHIFVWTVFSPKLLYEFYHLCLVFVIVCGTVAVNKIIRILS